MKHLTAGEVKNARHSKPRRETWGKSWVTTAAEHLRRCEILTEAKPKFEDAARVFSRSSGIDYRMVLKELTNQVERLLP